MTHSLTRNQLQKYVHNPTQKGLTTKQLEKSIPTSVDSCDDNFNIYIEIKDSVVEVARFDGAGCAISSGSVEAILQLIEGKNIKEISDIINIYNKFLLGEINSIDPRLEVFKIVQSHISRRKCAMAPIGAIRKAIENE